MTMSVPERISESGGKEEESEDESEILEESPCGRWQKRKEQVGQCIVMWPDTHRGCQSTPCLPRLIPSHI